MKGRRPVARLYAPLFIMLIFLGVLLLEKQGIFFGSEGVALALLPDEWHPEQTTQLSESASLLVGYLSTDEDEAPYVETLRDTLDLMRIPYQMVDLSRDPIPSLEGFDTFLLCSRFLQPVVDVAPQWLEWIEAGGHFGVLMTPTMDDALRILHRPLGITDIGDDYETFIAYRFCSDLMPLMNGFAYADVVGAGDDMLPVYLDEDCIVHIDTGENPSMPLMWERPVGDGRIIVCNTTLFAGKDSRGIVMSMLFALEDTVVYPIINAALVYIDDFPAPQPEGFDERLLADFGYDTQGFFRHLWWPDMKQIAHEYGIKYTGVLIETYNDKVKPPFDPEAEGALLRFYASELLHTGGEVGLHGYNHMPLCLDGFDYGKDVHYITWETDEDMSLATAELYRYGTELFPDNAFVTYVPPSNYLSDEGKAMLRRKFPQVRVISGLYLYEEGVDALVQEFTEEADGSISVPRLTSGFIPDQYNWLVLGQSLALQGVFSHFIHPDDVLDASRGADSGWTKMRGAFVEMLDAIEAAYPPLRATTSAEGAAAVQRYTRLSVTREAMENGLRITLDNFYDEAWLALHTSEQNITVRGGNLHHVLGELYWIEALSPELEITWGDGA